MSKIRQDDLIDSVCDALQFMSYFHPKDYIDAVYEAWLREESQAAKDAMAQILVNSRMCAEGRRPLCQGSCSSPKGFCCAEVHESAPTRKERSDRRFLSHRRVHKRRSRLPERIGIPSGR